MEVAFTGPVWEWRGPAPYHFVTVPEEDSAHIESLATAVTYGWGMIPVHVRLGETTWKTSLWPKDGNYVLPLKDMVRRAEQVAIGDVIDVVLAIDV
jgi:hypothetical protein